MRPTLVALPRGTTAKKTARLHLARERRAVISRQVSLNRCENALLHYLRAHPDEQRFWTARVLDVDRAALSREEKSATLERELRAYAAERAMADAVLRDGLGAGRVSMRNLAEHVLALWTPPRASASRSSPQPRG